MRAYVWPFLASAVFIGGVPDRSNIGRAQRAAAAQAGAVLEKKGYLVPARTVIVTSEVSGRITTLYCDEGTDVKKGDVLGQIDPTIYRLDHKRAEALVERAASRYEDSVRRK